MLKKRKSASPVRNVLKLRPASIVVKYPVRAAQQTQSVWVINKSYLMPYKKDNRWLFFGQNVEFLNAQLNGAET